MGSHDMRPSGVVGRVILAILAATGAAAGQQTTGSEKIVRSIDVTNARPILRAVEALRERYHIAITYEDPRYAYAQDLQDISYIHKGALASGVKLIAPRGGIIHFEYAEVGGKPQEDVFSLIRRLLTDYAAQGGPVFDVHERTTPSGPEWNVIAVRARGANGAFSDQPDILGAPIFIPKAKRSIADMLVEMLQQLRTETGYRIVLGTTERSVNTAELGANNVSAREVLLDLYGTSMVWDLNYDPEGDGMYVLNLVPTPQPPIPLNAYSRPPTPRLQPTLPVHVPTAATLHMATTRGGITHIQSILSQDGYYSGNLSGEWDPKTIDAIKTFQGANNIAVTGRLDRETIRKLGLDVAPPRPQ